jgi:hypothetical protein
VQVSYQLGAYISIITHVVTTSISKRYESALNVVILTNITYLHIKQMLESCPSYLTLFGILIPKLALPRDLPRMLLSLLPDCKTNWLGVPQHSQSVQIRLRVRNAPPARHTLTSPPLALAVLS